MVREKNVQRFSADVAASDGYLYTKPDHLSGRLANGRISAAVAQLADFRGKRVLDLGCGDGTYTSEFLALGAAEVLGTDAAEGAVAAATQRYAGDARVRFQVQDVYNVTPSAQRWDLMVVRGLLHHLYDVETAIAAICKLAHTVIVVEPNGYNPVLKLIERTSQYHIEHEEKSYSPHKLDTWFKHAGGRIVSRSYIGLVPFFCPDPAARLLKAVEPVIEWLPVVRQLGCAQYVMKIEMS